MEWRLWRAGSRALAYRTLTLCGIQNFVDAFRKVPAAGVFDIGVGVFAGDVALGAVFLMEEFLLVPGAGGGIAVDNNGAC